MAFKINFINSPPPSCWGYIGKYNKIFLAIVYANTKTTDCHLFEVEKWPSSWDIEKYWYDITKISKIIKEVPKTIQLYNIVMSEFVTECWQTHYIYQEYDEKTKKYGDCFISNLAYYEDIKKFKPTYGWKLKEPNNEGNICNSEND